MKKIGRNDKCHCTSGKKYKLCCLKKEDEAKMKEVMKYENGHPDSSENIKQCADFFRECYSDHKVIDISNYLNNNTYRIFQLTNYASKVIMIAEKNNHNAEVFSTRGLPENDIIIMYRGSYRTFESDSLDNVANSIDRMIQIRLAGMEDR